MDNRNALNISLILIFVIFISGCIDVTINQKIRSDGTTEINIVYDLSAAAAMMKQYGQEDFASGLRENLTKGCDNLTKSGLFRNVKCDYSESDNKISISAESVSSIGSSIFDKKSDLFFSKYRYDAKAVYNLFSMGTNSFDVQGNTMNDSSLLNMKALNAKWVYNLEMPGTITNADVGNVSGGKVVINIFDLIGKEHAYVESEELNILMLIIPIVIIAVIIIIIMALKRRNREAAALRALNNYRRTN
jgi:hypothetical protein